MLLRFVINSLQLILMPLFIMDFIYSFNDTITCGTYDERNVSEVTVKYTKLPIVIMKDSRKIVHCTIDSCNFTKDFREIVECNITLDKINYQLKLKCLQRNADWTPVGLWSLLVKNNDMIFIESGRCNLYLYGSECQEITTLDFQDNEKLTNYSSETFSPNGFTEIFNTTDLSTSFTKTQSDNILKIIAFGIVGSCVALTLLMCLIYNLCFRVYYRLKFTFNTDKKMSNCCKHAEQVDNSDIYLLNKLNRTKLKDIPIEGKPMKMNANRETLGSLPDHYCTIDRTSYSRKATTVKQSSRDTLDFDPYSTIEECLVDMKCNKLISSQFGITENIITSSVIIISDKSKDDVPIERVSKRLLDGNIYESIA
ncbi:uncharacterized protein LOC106051505 isoform X5 [Biomphalaria glabrata]|uniref:Uncharacterized protein LOC106051505 isoform X5 n=1 Tax=Biomphalaria glabrata TaxID=6526 RepID=A0A9W2YTH5_BIOGL|nr:uncharacterized protein LOC106051505 isoform X5 [Biomphalaria glabrata]